MVRRAGWVVTIPLAVVPVVLSNSKPPSTLSMLATVALVVVPLTQRAQTGLRARARLGLATMGLPHQAQRLAGAREQLAETLTAVLVCPTQLPAQPYFTAGVGQEKAAQAEPAGAEMTAQRARRTQAGVAGLILGRVTLVVPVS